MAQRGINKVILIGNLGRDPEVRYLPDGTVVASFSLATSETWKDKQSGEVKERTEWHRCSAFGRVAEIAGEYVRKGMKLYVEGRLRTRKWQDPKTGDDRYSTEVQLDQIQMLDRRDGGVAPESVRGGSSAASGSPEMDGFDDDITF